MPLQFYAAEHRVAHRIAVTVCLKSGLVSSATAG